MSYFFPWQNEASLKGDRLRTKACPPDICPTFLSFFYFRANGRKRENVKESKRRAKVLFMVANLAFLVPKNANLALFETSWHFFEEKKVPSSFWHFLAFFDVPSKFI